MGGKCLFATGFMGFRLQVPRKIKVQYLFSRFAIHIKWNETESRVRVRWTRSPRCGSWSEGVIIGHRKAISHGDYLWWWCGDYCNGTLAYSLSRGIEIRSYLFLHGRGVIIGKLPTFRTLFHSNEIQPSCSQKLGTHHISVHCPKK